jgi:cellulose synthase/poly-beta-1,6-N-acetylglucosamine synthase-like glycosyltransferase/peptidoglycan/xylan/chitin deacetylase (PgdA/CDA1 family)
VGKRKLRAHWVLLATLLSMLVVGLAVQAPARLGSTDLYRGIPSGDAGMVPRHILEGGPGVGMANGAIRSYGATSRSIALTFDDGPDPEWTPAILEVLTRHGVAGTFFVLGDQALKQPDLLRAITAQGSELGIHSFTHADLELAGPWRSALELRLSQLLLAGATGETTALLRPPFSSTAKALDDRSWRTIRSAAEDGYVTVLATKDSRDWTRPGAAAITGNLLPTGSGGEVVLLHDSGGDRSETVAALDELIPRLQAEGYRFTTASSALGLSDVVGPAPLLTRVAGSVLLWGLWASSMVVGAVTLAMVAAGLIALARALLLLVSARRHRQRQLVTLPAASRPGPVSVLVPAYNEEAGIEAAIRSLLASTHPVQVVVVDDGSTDRTSEIVAAMNHPQVTLVRQQNAGKPAALNTALTAAQHEIVVMVDGDTIFEPATISNLIRPFADPQVGAVSGNAKVANRGGLLGRWQHIEYVIGFNMDRRWYDLAGCMPTVPGAVGAFRASALRSVGGLSDDTLAEDTDLTMALGRAGWRVVYREDARAWTEAPASVRALWRQRYRWCYGTMQAMWKHRHGVLERGRGGRYSRRSLAYMTLFQVLMPLLAPAVDVFAIYGILFRDPIATLAIWLAFQTIDACVALYAFRLDGERRHVLWTLPLSQFFYRQLMYAVVIQSLATAVSGIRLAWQRMDRYGTFATGT